MAKLACMSEGLVCILYAHVTELYNVLTAHYTHLVEGGREYLY